MNEQTANHIKDRATWRRILYMLLFVVLYSIAEVVVGAVVVVQPLIKLTSGQTNPRLREFGAQLAGYMYSILLFLTFNSERHPFPFSEWPASAQPGRDIPSAAPESERP